MAGPIRGRLSGLRVRVAGRRRADAAQREGHGQGRGGRPPGTRRLATDSPVATIALGSDEPLGQLVQALDIGASAYVSAPRHHLDVDVADLPLLLDAVAQRAANRGQSAWVQLPGRCLPLTAGTVDARLKDLGSHPRLRILTSEGSGHIIENVALELWKQADRAYRSLSDDTAVRLTIPDAAPPRHGPARTEDHVDMPIDVVYTWVDAADPAWRELAAPYLDVEAIDPDRFTQADELRFSLRSVEVFAPWVNHVYVLSNCAPPAWFRETDRISWIGHEQVADRDLLPTFNSCAIDTFLHRIPGLSEHFLYLNDDFMLWDSVQPSTFFTWDGRSVARVAVNNSVIYLQQLVEAGIAVPHQHSRVNAARLLEERVGVFPSHVHAHVPYAMEQAFWARIEQDFPDELAATRAARTRSASDISFGAFLYHHYAYALGKAVYADAPLSLVTLNNFERKAMRRALHETPFTCFQDSHGSAKDAAFQAFKRASLERALPLASSFEAAP